MNIVRDPRGNFISEGDEVACNIPLGAAKIKSIAPILDNGPLHGGTVVIGIVEVRWLVPPGGGIGAHKITSNKVDTNGHGETKPS